MHFVDALDAPDRNTPVHSIVDGRPWHAACANDAGEPAQVTRLPQAWVVDCNGCGDEV